MSRPVHLLKARGFFWCLLALPGVYMTYRYVQGASFYGEYLHATGDLSARLLILAMAVTPLRLMFPRTPWVLWLLRHRRNIGVAAFGYAALHTVAYVTRHGTFAAVLEDAVQIAIWTGWAALFVMLALAATSNDASVRLLRRGWKWLHRAVYVAAAFTFAHWVVSAFDPFAGVVHLGVLASLEGIRLWKTYA